MDHSYGQFCTVARAAEALCERWTPLVVRELLCGSKRFNDLHRGVPRMSSSLLARRLRHLENMGVVRRTARGKVWEYSLTEAGEELRPIIAALGHWGARWVGSAARDDELDVGPLMWDIRRAIAHASLPAHLIVHFHFAGARLDERDWWLLPERGGMALCRDAPPRPPDLRVRATVRALARIWHGDCTPQQVLADQSLSLEGPGELALAFGQWLGSSRWPGLLVAGGHKTAGTMNNVQH